MKELRHERAEGRRIDGSQRRLYIAEGLSAAPPLMERRKWLERRCEPRPGGREMGLKNRGGNGLCELVRSLAMEVDIGASRVFLCGHLAGGKGMRERIKGGDGSPTTRIDLITW
jgi:hypothetical protein